MESSHDHLQISESIKELQITMVQLFRFVRFWEYDETLNIPNTLDILSKEIHKLIFKYIKSFESQIERSSIRDHWHQYQNSFQISSNTLLSRIAVHLQEEGNNISASFKGKFMVKKRFAKRPN